MDPTTLYELNDNTLTSFKSIKPVNMMSDRLIKFSIGQLSDFKLKVVITVIIWIISSVIVICFY